MGIGGPPCIDFSPVNAHRQGATGKQGSYMVRFGCLIHEICSKQERPLFFCAENVPIYNDKHKCLQEGDLSKIQEAFGTKWAPAEIDAKYLSPCIGKEILLPTFPSIPWTTILLSACVRPRHVLPMDSSWQLKLLKMSK